MTKPKLLEQIKIFMLTKNYSPRTIQAYSQWIKRFIIFNNKTHPKLMGENEIKKYLTYLAVNKNVAPKTHNQALQAILFLYKNILEMDVGWLNNIPRPIREKHIPVVYSKKRSSSNIVQHVGVKLTYCVFNIWNRNANIRSSPSSHKRY